MKVVVSLSASPSTDLRPFTSTVSMGMYTVVGDPVESPGPPLKV